VKRNYIKSSKEFFESKVPGMKRVRKRKSDMTSSGKFSLAGENRLREFIGRRILSPGVFFFEGDYLPRYEETCLSLPFEEENGDRSKDHRENTLRVSEADTLSMEQGNREKLNFSFSVEFTMVSGLG
jgi:hypothetical protein